jgi:hypothetical protein
VAASLPFAGAVTTNACDVVPVALTVPVKICVAADAALGASNAAARATVNAQVRGIRRELMRPHHRAGWNQTHPWLRGSHRRETTFAANEVGGLPHSSYAGTRMRRVRRSGRMLDDQRSSSGGRTDDREEPSWADRIERLAPAADEPDARSPWRRRLD